jgi:hypothetical protein
LATESIDPSPVTSDVDEWSSSPVDLDVKQTDQHFFPALSNGRHCGRRDQLIAYCQVPLSTDHHSILAKYFIGMAHDHGMTALSRPFSSNYIAINNS